jgi:ribosomal protein S27E
MKIYKITSPNTDLVYVGHTDNIHTRFRDHRSKYKGWLAGKRDRCCTSRKVLEHGGAIIELIEETEDEEREVYWIRELNACNEKRNIHVDYQAYNREYNQTNKHAISSQKKVYYEENKEKILEKRQMSYPTNGGVKIPCDNCGRLINRSNMTVHQKTKACRNKEPIREKPGKMMTCDNCGRVVTRVNIHHHKKTKCCREKTKDILEKIACDICGRVVTRSGISVHKRSKRCQNTASTL